MDFDCGPDSTNFVRERARGSKLEGVFKKRKGILLEQSEHTITFLPGGCQHATTISKLDLGGTARKENEPCCSREANKRNMANNYEVEDHAELPTSNELPANSESARETGKPNNDFQQFPPRKEIEEKHEKSKQQPAANKQQTNKTSYSGIEEKRTTIQKQNGQKNRNAVHNMRKNR